MRLVQGNNQSGAVSTALSTTLKVQVFNAGTTTTAAGVVVEWVDPTTPTVVVATSTTDSTGTASYTWTLQGQIGAQQLTARVRSEPRAAVTFSATATSGTSTGTITAATTTSQTATKGTAVGVPPSVLVVDTGGNPVSGKDVIFTMTAGSGTLSPASPATVTTDANGLATLTSWTLGASAGTNTVTAALAGYTGSPVTFNATGANALPTQIAKTSGDAQTNVTAGAAATAFTATVKDVSNTAVQNVDVLWTIVTGAGTLTGGQTTATATTDASGVSTTTLTTNATVGSFSVTASFVDATGTTQSVTFTGSTVAGASTKWLIRTQPSSNVSSGTPFSQQPILYLADANSNAVATAGVVCTAARASGSDTLAGTLTATTDSTGTATFVNLTFNVVGAGGANTLQFTGGSKTAATSSTVTVAPPVAVGVLWGTQPTTTTTGVVMQAFTVRVVDNTNTTVPADTSLVTIALVGSGTATGTLSVNASGGVATFSNVTVTGTGTFSFDASCSNFPVVRSSSFTSNAVGTTFPNEPGYTRIAEHDCASSPTSTPASVGIAGKWANFTGSVGSVDPTTLSPATFNPYGDPKVWRFQYTSSVVIGSGTANLQGWDSSPFASQLTQKSSMYLAFWFCAYGDGSTFEMATTQIKPWGYIAYGVGSGSAQNQGYWILQSNSPAGSFVTSLDLSWRQQGTGHTWPSAVNLGTITVGQWYLFESKHVINSAADAADGTMDCWLTPYGGTAQHTSRSNIVYKWGSNTNGFSLWKDNNIYGGSGSLSKTRTDSFLIAHPKITGNP